MRAVRAVFALEGADALAAGPAPWDGGSRDPLGIAVLILSPTAWPPPWWVDAVVDWRAGIGPEAAVTVLRRRLGPLGDGVDWRTVAATLAQAVDSGSLPPLLPGPLAQVAGRLVRRATVRPAPVTTEGLLAALGF